MLFQSRILCCKALKAGPLTLQFLSLLALIRALSISLLGGLSFSPTTPNFLMSSFGSLSSLIMALSVQPDILSCKISSAIFLTSLPSFLTALRRTLSDIADKTSFFFSSSIAPGTLSRLSNSLNFPISFSFSFTTLHHLFFLVGYPYFFG